jgi:hypothetical protein
MEDHVPAMDVTHTLVLALVDTLAPIVKHLQVHVLTLRVLTVDHVSAMDAIVIPVLALVDTLVPTVKHLPAYVKIIHA